MPTTTRSKEKMELSRSSTPMKRDTPLRKGRTPSMSSTPLKISTPKKMSTPSSTNTPIHSKSTFSTPYKKGNTPGKRARKSPDNQTPRKHRKTDDVVEGEDLLLSRNGISLCEVCQENINVTEDEEMITCTRCRLKLHSDCYKISKFNILQNGKFICDLCYYNQPTIPECELCPISNIRAMKSNKDRTQWVHLTCIYYTGELSFNLNSNCFEGMNSINSRKFRLKCKYCGIQHGSCLQCSHTNCYTAYHIYCAKINDCKEEVVDDNNEIRTYCTQHGSKIRDNKCEICISRTNLDDLKTCGSCFKSFHNQCLIKNKYQKYKFQKCQLFDWMCLACIEQNLNEGKIFKNTISNRCTEYTYITKSNISEFVETPKALLPHNDYYDTNSSTAGDDSDYPIIPIEKSKKPMKCEVDSTDISALSFSFYLSNITKDLAPKHQIYIKHNILSYISKYSLWFQLMLLNYNICLYGYGSKLPLLEYFIQTHCFRYDTIFVQSKFDIKLKDFLHSILSNVFNINSEFKNPLSAIEAIESNFSSSKKHLFVIIQNIESQFLTNSKFRFALSRLLKIENIHCLSTIEHINASYSFSKTLIDTNNILFYDCTTYLHYTHELASNIRDIFSDSDNTSRYQHVLRSLTKTHIDILKLILSHSSIPTTANSTSRGGGTSSGSGVHQNDLYKLCIDNLLVSSRANFDTLMKELFDHEIVKESGHRLHALITEKIIDSFLSGDNL